MDPILALIKYVPFPTDDNISIIIDRFYRESVIRNDEDSKDIIIKPSSKGEDELNIINAYLPPQIEKRRKYFDKVDPGKFKECREITNPTENVTHSIFSTRAAVKLASIDAVFGITDSYKQMSKTMKILSESKGVHEGIAKIKATKPVSTNFTFADLAGGPGSFTRYILWKEPKSTGWGITLRSKKNELNWFEDLLKSKRFKEIYGPANDGNLYNEDNMRAFIRQVISESKNGVNLVVADGGFGFEDNSSNQEMQIKRLLLDEIISSLSINKIGGNAVYKIYDIFTEYTLDLLYILHRSYTAFAVFKPATSRPGNSEKYVVCLGYKGPNMNLIEGLFKVNKNFDANIRSLFPYATISQEFIKYIHYVNSIISNNQNEVLANIIKCIEGKEVEHDSVYNLSLIPQILNIPDIPRSERKKVEKHKNSNSERKIEKHIGIPSRKVFKDNNIHITLGEKAPISKKVPERVIANEYEWIERSNLLSDIQFISGYVKGKKDIKIVYAGINANNTSIAYLSLLIDLFPDSYEWVLYIEGDLTVVGNKITEDREERVTIYNNSLSEEEAKDIGGDVYFINLDPGTDTLYQIIQPIKASLAFNAESNFSQGKISGANFSQKAGTIYFQPWTKQLSTQTRLVPGDEHEIDKDKYITQMNYFSNITRLSSYNNRIRGEGIDNCFDCTLEIEIIKQYMLFKYPKRDPPPREVSDMSRMISRKLSTDKNLNLLNIVNRNVVPEIIVYECNEHDEETELEKHIEENPKPERKEIVVKEKIHSTRTSLEDERLVLYGFNDKTSVKSGLSQVLNIGDLQWIA